MFANDPSLTWADLDNKPLEFVTDARPSSLCLVAHARRAVLQAEQEGWIPKVRYKFEANVKAAQPMNRLAFLSQEAQGLGWGQGCRRGLGAVVRIVTWAGMGKGLGRVDCKRSVAMLPHLHLQPLQRRCTCSLSKIAVVTFPRLPLHLLAAGLVQDPECSRECSSHSPAAQVP